MSTTKPRVTVTLEPRTYEVLSRLAAVGGESMSALIAQFIDLAIPSMERLVVVLERAAAAPQEARAGLAAAVERAERDLIPALVAAQAQADWVLDDALGGVKEGRGAPAATAAAAAQRKRRQASEGRLTPVPVTRGSGREKQGGKGVRRG